LFFDLVGLSSSSNKSLFNADAAKSQSIKLHEFHFSHPLTKIFGTIEILFSAKARICSTFAKFPCHIAFVFFSITSASAQPTFSVCSALAAHTVRKT